MVKKIIIILALIASSYAVTLNCEYSFEWWPLGGDKYSCVTQISEVSTNQRLTSVSGDHQANKNHSHVEAIEFNECNGSTFIPQNMLNFFANLIGIRLINCGTLILDGDELNKYQNLQLFAVESTQLERIPGNFFASTPQISVIGFADNNLKYVGSKLLQSLENLLWISFYNNGCINQTATSSNEIPSLIDNLKANCVDIFEETTTTTSTAIMTSSEQTSDSTTNVNDETTKAGGARSNEGNILMVVIILLTSLIIKF